MNPSSARARAVPSPAGRRRWTHGLALVALSLASGAAFAWSAKGHSMVGDIATQYLTPEAKAEIVVLLRDDRLADDRPSGRTTLAEVASWPDELRATPEQRATGAYHFDDVPICGVPDPAKYCPDGKCATAWFAKQVLVLKDRSQPARARNEALKWIVHLAGDMHQPLHQSDDDDRGGNDVKITFLGKRADDPAPGRESYPYNLHTAWDRLIPYKLFDDAGGYDRFLADRPSATTRADWSVGTMDQWAVEGFVLARDFVYPALPVAQMCPKPIKATVAIDATYDRNAAVIVEMQLRKAGVRLAKVLNEILTGP